MKKFNLLFLFLVLLGFSLKAQVTVSPAIFTANQAVTLTYDATLSQGAALANLPANVTTITAHVGAIIDNATSTNWTNVPGTWGDPNAQPKFTRTGTSNIYTLTLANGVRSLFSNLPANATLFRVGMVFRENGPCGGFGGNNTGCKEGKSPAGQDIFLDVNQGGFALAVSSPATTGFFVNVGDNVTITANSNQNATLKIFLNNTEIESVSNTTTISKVVNVTAGTAQYSIKITANDGTTTLEKNVSFVLRQNPTIADVPAGLKDGINYNIADPTKATLVLYAPLKSKVYLLGDFNDWDLNANYHLKKSTDNNRYWLELTGLTSGQEYAYQYAVYDDTENRILTGDPYSDKILDPNNDRFIPTTVYPNLKAYPTKATGIVSVLQTNQTPYVWQTTNYQRPAKDNLVVYELLVRDFDTPKDYQAVIDRLDYLKDLGINAIELMPIMEFAGNNSWGYNPIYYLAVDKAYGTKNKLKELIDKAHAKGIAVILDMVLNQADYEFPYVKMYWDGANSRPAANNPYFNQQATHPFSVFFDFNHEKQATKDLVDRINRYWLEEYKFDGYRFDLSKGFTQTVNTDVGQWSNYDASRIAILKRMADQIWSFDANAYVILEHLGANNEEKELAEYRSGEGKGMMLWGNMHGPYKQNTIGFGSNSDISGMSARSTTNGFGRGWNVKHLVGYMESHDEERQMYDALQNGNSSNANHNVKNLNIGLERVKTSGAFAYLVPGPKLIWQFGELGYDKSINTCSNGTVNNDCRTGEKPILWEYFENVNRKKIYDVFSELFKLKTTHSVFNTNDVSIIGGSSLQKQITLTNTPYTATPANTSQMNVLILGNFDVTAQNITPNFQHTGTWYHYFDNSTLNVTNTNASINLQPGEFRIYTDVQLPATESELTFYVRPNAPTNLVSASAVCGVKIDWSDVSSIETGFKILRSTTANGTYTQIGTVNANATTFTDNGVSPNTTYYYKVVANNAFGEKESSVLTVNAATYTAPNPATNIVAQSPNSAIAINLTWTDSNDETSYRIERSPTANGTFTPIIENLPANTTSYQDVNVTIGATYFYKVCAVKCNLSTCSNATSQVVTALENSSLSRSIQVYPNPSTDKLNLTWENLNLNQFDVQIFDVYGRELNNIDLKNQTQVGRVEMDIKTLPKGIYILQIKTEQGFAVKRIVKQ